jgi:hypothetical protein
MSTTSPNDGAPDEGVLMRYEYDAALDKHYLVPLGGTTEAGPPTERLNIDLGVKAMIDKAKSHPARIITPSGSRKLCGHCKATLFHGGKKCGKCEMQYYCSKECQRHHWPSHRTLCNDAEAPAIVVCVNARAQERLREIREATEFLEYFEHAEAMRAARERVLTQDQVIITRSIQEEQSRRRRVEQDAIATKVMLEVQADPSANKHGYSAAGLESLSHMAQHMLSMAQPEDQDNLLAAVSAMDDAEVKAFQRADRERRSVRRGKAACGHCGQHGALHKCGGCHSDSPARYCDQDCQRAAWKGGHKDACLRMKKPRVESEPFGGRFPKGGYNDLE